MTDARISRAASLALEAFLWLAVIVVSVSAVAAPLLGPGGLGVGTGPTFGDVPSVQVTLDAERVLIETNPQLPSLGGARGEVKPGDGVEFTIPTGAEVGLFSPDWRQRLGLVGSQVLRGLVVVTVLVVLLQLVRSLREGDPFVPGNAARLYLIAGAVGIGGQAAEVLYGWGRTSVLSHPLVAPFVLHDASLSFLPLFSGLGVAVAAEVFRQGAVLRQEVEGLV